MQYLNQVWDLASWDYPNRLFEVIIEIIEIKNNNNYARILILFMLMIIPTSLWNTLTEFFESILL